MIYCCHTVLKHVKFRSNQLFAHKRLIPRRSLSTINTDLRMRDSKSLLTISLFNSSYMSNYLTLIIALKGCDNIETDGCIIRLENDMISIQFAH